jgi:hypothetical protein
MSSEDMDTPLTADEKHTALFAQLVMQSASMAMMFMGRAPNPMTGKTERDLDAARMFIEQLEMLEAKTKGNLSAQEQQLLKQNLMTVRMSFVEAVQEGQKKPLNTEAPKPVEPAPSPEAGSTEESSKRKFSKSYGEG